MLVRFDPFRDFSRMPLDVYRHGDEFVLRVDLPGVDPASIDVLVEGKVLTIKAERTWTPADGDKVITAERAHGTFTRRLVLGNAVDASKIAAGYEHGVLTVTVPAAEKAKAHRVEITVGGKADEDRSAVGEAA